MALLAARSQTLEGRPAEDVAKLVAYSSDQVLHPTLCVEST